MLVSIAILFGTISVCVATLFVYSAVVVATRAQDSMKSIPLKPQQDFHYEGRFDQAPAMAAAS